MEFIADNGKKLVLEQEKPNGLVTVTAYCGNDKTGWGCELQYAIAPWDFVKMLSWYRAQTQAGNKTLAF